MHEVVQGYARMLQFPSLIPFPVSLSCFSFLFLFLSPPVELGLFTVPYYGYGRILYGYFTVTSTRQPYRIKTLKNL